MPEGDPIFTFDAGGEAMTGAGSDGTFGLSNPTGATMDISRAAEANNAIGLGVDAWGSSWFLVDEGATALARSVYGKFNAGGEWLLNIDGDMRPHFYAVGTTTAEVIATGSTTRGEWHHVAWFYEDAAGEISLYVDGVLAGTAPSDGIQSVGDYYSIGLTGGAAVQWHGMLDELAFGCPPTPIGPLKAQILAATWNGGMGCHLDTLPPGAATRFGVRSWLGLEEESGPRFDSAAGNYLFAYTDAPRGPGAIRTAEERAKHGSIAKKVDGRSIPGPGMAYQRGPEKLVPAAGSPGVPIAAPGAWAGGVGTALVQHPITTSSDERILAWTYPDGSYVHLGVGGGRLTLDAAGAGGASPVSCESGEVFGSHAIVGGSVAHGQYVRGDTTPADPVYVPASYALLEIVGEPALLHGKRFTVAGAGPTFDGTYALSSVVKLPNGNYEVMYNLGVDHGEGFSASPTAGTLTPTGELYVVPGQGWLGDTIKVFPSGIRLEIGGGTARFFVNGIARGEVPFTLPALPTTGGVAHVGSDEDASRPGQVPLYARQYGAILDADGRNLEDWRMRVYDVGRVGYSESHRHTFIEQWPGVREDRIHEIEVVRIEPNGAGTALESGKSKNGDREYYGLGLHVTQRLGSVYQEEDSTHKTTLLVLGPRHDDDGNVQQRPILGAVELGDAVRWAREPVYVDPAAGSDETGDGTQGSPFRSSEAAAATAPDGAAIRVVGTAANHGRLSISGNVKGIAIVPDVPGERFLVGVDDQNYAVHADGNVELVVRGANLLKGAPHGSVGDQIGLLPTNNRACVFGDLYDDFDEAQQPYAGQMVYGTNNDLCVVEDMDSAPLSSGGSGYGFMGAGWHRCATRRATVNRAGSGGSHPYRRHSTHHEQVAGLLAVAPDGTSPIGGLTWRSGNPFLSLHEVNSEFTFGIQPPHQDSLNGLSDIAVPLCQGAGIVVRNSHAIWMNAASPGGMRATQVRCDTFTVYDWVNDPTRQRAGVGSVTAEGCVADVFTIEGDQSRATPGGAWANDTPMSTGDALQAFALEDRTAELPPGLAGRYIVATATGPVRGGTGRIRGKIEKDGQEVIPSPVEVVFLPAGAGTHTLRAVVEDAAGASSVGPELTIVVPDAGSQAPVSSYDASGPTSAKRGRRSGAFVVALGPGTLDGPIVVTPSDGGAGGSFTPASVTLTAAARSGQVRYNVPAGAGDEVTVSFSDDGGLDDPAPIALAIVEPIDIEAPSATLTLSVPSASGGGGGPYSYQWQRNEGSGWSDVVGEATTSIAIDLAAGQPALRFRARAQDVGSGVGFSAEFSAQQRARSMAAFPRGSGSGDVAVGGPSASSEVSVPVPTGGDGGPYDFAWERNDGDGWVVVDGETTTTIVVDVPSQGPPVRLRFRVADGSGTVDYSPEFTVQPRPMRVAAFVGNSMM